MAQLAKDQRSSSCSFQGALNSQDGSSFSPLIHFQNLPSLNPSPGFYMFEDDQYHQKQQHLHHHLGLNHTSDSYTEGHHGEMSESQQQVVRNSPDLSSSSSADSSNEFAFSNSAASYHQLDDQVAPSLIHFKTTQGNGGGDGFINGSGGSSISFQLEGVVDYGFVGQEKENYAWWESSIINDYQRQQQQGVNGSGLRVLEGVNNHELPKGSDMMYGEAMRSDGEISAKESTNKQQACLKKRAITEEDNIQTPKKQCTSSKKQAISKAKSSSPPTASKDSMQSAAAKNRRERISERLKTLQDLVPNGSKVDMVTMLEKAIGYVKFLQLQVKVLAADEFWPAAGGKAPDISQVREALDAILQRDRNSTSQKATVEGFD